MRDFGYAGGSMKYSLRLNLRQLLTILTIASTAWIMRFAALHSLNAKDHGPDYYLGGASDFGIALIFVSLAFLFSGRSRVIAATVLGIAHSLLVYANYEHVVILQSSIDFYNLQYLGDKTFVTGSLTTISQPWLLIGMIIIPIVALPIILWPIRRDPTSYGIIALTLAVNAYVLFMPPNDSADSWRQYHVLHQNAFDYGTALGRSLQSTSSDDVEFTSSNEGDQDTAMEILDDLMRPDLSGSPRIPLGKRRNVLLIMLESLYGGSFRGVAGKALYDPSVRLWRTDAQVDNALVYRNMLLLNRKTNNGEYAAICGDFPNVNQPGAKMDAYVLEPAKRRPCLPHVLSKNGYNTVYLQAAELTFMLKDQFMPLAGFNEVLGKEWFADENAHAWGGWGPDDQTLLEESLKKVKDLKNQENEKPWFMMIMSSGTHHPFRVGKNWYKSKTNTTFKDSVEYLDQALARYLKDLKKMGVLDNTLVVITSDESRGVSKGTPYQLRLSQNWAPLMIITPEQDSQIIDQRYATSDFPISILDYLGIESNEEFAGRSFFRHYNQAPRAFFVGNVYTGQTGMWKRDGSFVWCNRSLDDCKNYPNSNKRIMISGKEESHPADPRDAEIIKLFSQRNDNGIRRQFSNGEYMIAAPRKLTPAADSSRIEIIGRQDFIIPQSTEFELTFKMTQLKGECQLVQRFQAKEPFETLRFPDGSIKAGEKLLTRLKFVTDQPIEDASFHIGCKTNGSDVEISVDSAKIKAQPRTADKRTGLINMDSQVR